MKENEVSGIRGNEITLNADRISEMSDDEIIKIVRHELNHYIIDRCIRFREESRARVRAAILSGELTPVDETGEKTSEEIYAELLAEENAKKVK